MPDLEALRIPLPPVEEQRRIADFLDDQVARIDAVRKAASEGLDLWAQRQFAAMAEALSNPLWPKIRLSRVLVGGVRDGPHETPSFLAEGVPFLSVDDIRDDRIDWDVSRFISADAHEVYSRRCSPGYGDVLLTKAASVGKVAVVDRRDAFNVWSPIAVLRPAPNLLRPNFLAWLLRSSDLQYQMRSASTSSTQYNLAMSDIGALRVSVPDLSEQASIEDHLNRERYLRDEAQAHYATLRAGLEERKRAIITAAVTGELDVTTARPIGVGKWVPNVGASVDNTTAGRVQAPNIGGIG